MLLIINDIVDLQCSVLLNLLSSVFLRQLHLFLSMLLHKDEDVKSESTSNIEKEDLSAIVSIFQSIKSSEDIYDAVKSKVEYRISLVHIVCFYSYMSIFRHPLLPVSSLHV